MKVLKNIIKNIFGEEEAEEFETNVLLSDGCKEDEAISKILEKIKGDEPC